MITKEFVESLGWKFDYLWNNRMMFSYKDSNYSIFEHNGDWGIMNPYSKFELIYCNMRPEHIKNFTNLIKSLEQILDNPTATALYDFIEASTKMKDFVKKMKARTTWLSMKARSQFLI